MRDYSLLTDFLSNNNYDITDEQINKLDCYYEFLFEKNKLMNLTSITKFEEVLEKHFLDSAAIISVFNMNNINSLIDIGTGAGFPGIVIKILFPDIKVILLDSLLKRVNFLNNTIELLKLSDINAVHSRAEDAARESVYREKFDLCVSRAVAGLNILTELCMPFVKKNGYFIPYKSGKITDEISISHKAINLMGGQIDDLKEILLGPSKLLRTFPVIKKINNTPDLYPRKAGTPSKKPL